MFFRGNKNANGNGLGLYIAKETVEKLKESLSFSSTLNEGTAFTIELPAMQPEPATSEKTEIHS